MGEKTPPGFMTMEEAEQFIQEYEAKLRRLRDRLMSIEQRLPHLTEDERIIWNTVLRETLIEIANVKVPEEINRQLPPEIVRRFDEMMKAILPDDH
jgi:uncharacterized HAD superfamily protein